MSNDCPASVFHDETLERWRAAAHATDLQGVIGTAKSIGVVVPHADDETLGCGGLVCAAAAADIAITVTILTDGAASHPGSFEWPPARLAGQRQAEAKAAVAALTNGQGTVVFAGAPDGLLADHPGAGNAIPAADLYITCWQDDPHPDHRAAFSIAQAASRRFAAPLLAFPIWVLTTDIPVPALPLLSLDISAQFAHKRMALAHHRSQLGQLVRDTPGFTLDDNLQRLFVRPDELFLRIPA